jgi:putative membrane protein
MLMMTILPTIPSSFLTFGEHPLYPIYETFPAVGGLSTLEDMQIAGLIMKIGGGFLLWGIITVMFFRWASSEERTERDQLSVPPPRPSDLPTT